MAEAGWLKALHVAGAVLLLGNVVVTGLWAALLWRARPRVPFRPVARAILWADLFFTLGGGALLTVSGVLLVRAHGYPWRELPWLRHGIGALAIATAVWLVALLPAQVLMERLPEDDPRLARAFWWWSVVGWADTLVLCYALWVMVTRS